MTASARQRLFFALWPDDATRRALASLVRAHLAAGRGRPVAPANLHLTLEFLGGVDAAFRACAERAAASVSATAFELELRRIGHWPRPRVLWSAPEETPDALVGLVDTLRSALVACGHEPDPRPYRAHVTLARKVRARVPTAAHAPIRWPVSEFCLVASETDPRGARYSPLARWSLDQVRAPRRAP